MRFISCHDGKLQTLAAAGLKSSPAKAFATGLAALDALAPRQSFARGAVHELLFDPGDGEPKFVAAVLAQSAALLPPLPLGEGWGEGLTEYERLSISNQPFTPTLSQRDRGQDSASIIWADPRRDVYPPALAALGFDLTKVYLLHPPTEADEGWAVAECLRCRGVGAVVAAPPRLSRIAARRLQLAAERGGSVGILLRQKGRGDSIYAAATRWLVSPHPGERMTQRWKIQLLHGHGGRVGETVILEWCREDNSVRAVEKLADRPAAANPASRATA